MAITINQNSMATNTSRNLSKTYDKLGTSIQRMSTGLRVNTAADDAAGLAIREMMRADITATQQGIRNAADAISLIQTADGALGVVDEKLTRMKELAEQAATGTYTTVQRDIINSEYQAMAAEIDRIASATNFNGIKLLDGSVSNQHGGQGIKVHFGTGNEDSEDYYFLKIGDARATSSTGLQVGGDAKNDIWGQGGAAGSATAAGCCANGFDSLAGQAGFVSGQSFSYGYNWDWQQDDDAKLESGKYIAGRYQVGASDSLQDLVDKVNAGTQSRVAIEVDASALNDAVGQGSGTAAVCIGNESYYWGDAEEVEGNQVSRVKTAYKGTADYAQNKDGRLATIDASAAAAFAMASATAEADVQGAKNSALGAEALNAAMDKRFTHTVMEATDPDALMAGRDPEYDENSNALQARKNRDAPLNAAIATAKSAVTSAQDAYDTAYANARLTGQAKAAVDDYLQARQDLQVAKDQSATGTYTALSARVAALKDKLGDSATKAATIATAQDALFTAKTGLNDANKAKDAETEAQARLKEANALVKRKEAAKAAAKNNTFSVSDEKTAANAAKGALATALGTAKTNGKYTTLIAADNAGATSAKTVAQKQALVDAYLTEARNEAKTGTAGTYTDSDIKWSSAGNAEDNSNGAHANKATISATFTTEIAAAKAAGYAERAESVTTKADTAIQDPSDASKLAAAQTEYTGLRDKVTADTAVMDATNGGKVKAYIDALAADAKDGTDTAAAKKADYEAAVLSADLGGGKVSESDLGKALEAAAKAYGTAQKANDAGDPVKAATDELGEAKAAQTAAQKTLNDAKNAETLADTALTNAKTSSGTYEKLSDLAPTSASVEAFKSAVDAYLSAVASDQVTGKDTATALGATKFTGTTIAASATTADTSVSDIYEVTQDTTTVADLFGPQGTAAADKLYDKAVALGQAKAAEAAKVGIGSAVNVYRGAAGLDDLGDIADAVEDAVASALAEYDDDSAKGDRATFSKGIDRASYAQRGASDVVEGYKNLATGVYVNGDNHATSAAALYAQAKKAGWNEIEANIGDALSEYVSQRGSGAKAAADTAGLVASLKKAVTTAVANRAEGGKVYTAKAFEAADLAGKGAKVTKAEESSYIEKQAGIVDSGNQKIKVASNGEGSNMYKASALAAAINGNKNSDYWAMTEKVTDAKGDTSDLVYVFAKEGGDNNKVKACEQAGRNGDSKSAVEAFRFQNVQSGQWDDEGATLSLGGEHWGTMTPMMTKSAGGKETWNVTLSGRDVGKERDLRIVDMADLATPNMDEEGIAGLGKNSFVEMQNAANAPWAGAEVRTQSSAQEALDALSQAIVNKDKIRADLGAMQNRLENTMTNLEIQAENLQASESGISDVDTAKEMTEFTKNNVLVQAGVSMLAQANSMSQLALSLMR